MTTTPNTPASNVEKQKNDTTQKNTIYELLGEVTEDKVFQGLQNEAELIQEIKNSPNDMTADIRSEMRHKLLTSPE